MTEYVREFVQESEASITELNNALLELERNPGDDEAMDGVFRTAHTLKGNASAMGFDRAADLAHAIEDLLDAIRAGSLEVSADLMDEVFDAVDLLDRMVDEVDDEGEIRTDPTDRIEALRSRIEESTGLRKPREGEIERLLADAPPVARRHGAYHARLSLAEAPDSGATVVDAIRDAFDLLATDPDEGEIREGGPGVMDVAFGSAVDEASIAAALNPVVAVEDAIITEVPDDVLSRGPGDEDAPSTAEAADMEVDELLDQFDEYDDLDEAADRVEDVAGLEEMGEAGAFDDIVEDEVTPAHEEGGGTDAGDPGADPAGGAGTDAPASEDEEVEDAMETFSELQEEVDQVGIDRMEEELEGVSFGEYDEEDEVGFDELLGDDYVPFPEEADPADVRAEPADAEPADVDADSASEGVEPAESGDAEATAEEPAPSVDPPDEAAVEAAVESATPPSDPDRRSFLARLGIDEGAGPGAADRAVEALRDAFDLLGTRPPEAELADGDHGGTVDAVFGSDVGEVQIRLALDPLEAVADAAVVEVTDRMPAPEPAADQADATADAPGESGSASTGPEADAASAESAPEAEATGSAGQETDVAPDPEDLDEDVVAAEGQIEDPSSEFEQMQAAYDEVGLDELEEELAGVSFGEYETEDEVGFDELLGEEFEEGEDVDAEPTPEAGSTPDPTEASVEAGEANEAGETTATGATPETDEAGDEAEIPAVAPPDDAAVDAAVEAAGSPTDSDHEVYFVRLAIVDGDRYNNGVRVVEALRDAFELLGTRPPEPEIDAGEYGDSIDAVFGSHVGEDQIRAALDPVDEVADAAVVEVTDRTSARPPAATGEADAEPAPDLPADADPAGVDEFDDEVIAAEGEIEDPASEFEQMQAAYDEVGLDELEEELAGVSFGEHDAEEEVGFEELIGDEGAADAPEEGVDVEADTGTEAEPGTGDAGVGAGSTASDEFGGVGTGDDFGDIEADEEFAADEGFGEVEFDESGEDFADADEGVGDVGTGDEFADADAGEEFGDVDTDEGFGDTGATEEFGDVDTDAADDFGEVDTDAGEEFGDVDTDAGEEFGDVDTDAGEEFGEVEVGDADFEEPGVEEGIGGDAVPDAATDDVDAITGIGTAYADRLAEADVETVGDLVRSDPEVLATATEISESRIEDWIDRAPVEAADLAREATGAADAAEATDATGAEPVDAGSGSVGAGAPETGGFGDAGAGTGTGADTAPDAGTDAAEAGADAGAGETEPEQEPAVEPEHSVDDIQSIRVDVDRVDDLLDLVEGLVTSRARMRRALESGAPRERLAEELDELDVISAEMQDAVVEMRLVPFREVTGRLPRVVRDVARDQGKEVRFETEGEDVEVDRSILDRLGDPLVHLVRNAVDHGIESPDEREAAGKDREGTVSLRASRERDLVTIEVEDDGRGLDPDELRRAAVEEGVIPEAAAEALSDDDAYGLVFESGLSTREEVTDVSGRGVGMDVVASVVEDLDGEVEVESTPGEGTTVRLVLPVTVAIAEMIFLESGDEEYGLPVRVVDEIGAMGLAETVSNGEGERVRTAGGDEHDLVRLHEALDVPNPAATDGEGMFVTIEDEVRDCAIQCDDVRGQQEVVVKPFEGLLSGIPGLDGAAVLGEGAVVTVLDVESL